MYNIYKLPALNMKMAIDCAEKCNVKSVSYKPAIDSCMRRGSKLKTTVTFGLFLEIWLIRMLF